LAGGLVRENPSKPLARHGGALVQLRPNAGGFPGYHPQTSPLKPRFRAGQKPAFARHTAFSRRRPLSGGACYKTNTRSPTGGLAPSDPAPTPSAPGRPLAQGRIGGRSGQRVINDTVFDVECFLSGSCLKTEVLNNSNTEPGTGYWIPLRIGLTSVKNSKMRSRNWANENRCPGGAA
jgi:hypothetical protein